MVAPKNVDYATSMRQSLKFSFIALIAGTVGFGLGTAVSKNSTKRQAELSSIEDNQATTLTFGERSADTQSQFTEILELAKKASGGNKRDLAILSFVESLDEKGVEEYARHLFSLPANERNSDMIKTVYYRWAELNAHAAAEHARSQNILQKYHALSSVISFWSEKSPEAAWTWLEKANGIKHNNRHHLETSIIKNLAERDPQAAIRLAKSKIEEGKAVNKRSHIEAYKVWAKSDPAAVARTLSDLTEGWQRRTIIESIASSWTKSDPQNAWKWANSLQDSDERGEAIRNIISDTVYENMGLAIQFFKELPPSANNKKILWKISNKMAESDPKSAVDFVVKNSRGAWSAGDPDFVFTWILWARKDPDEALSEAIKYAKNSGGSWESAYTSIIDVVAQTDTEKAKWPICSRTNQVTQMCLVLLPTRFQTIIRRRLCPGWRLCRKAVLVMEHSDRPYTKNQKPIPRVLWNTLSA